MSVIWTIAALGPASHRGKVKIAGVVVVGILGLALVAGCGGGSSPSAGGSKDAPGGVVASESGSKSASPSATATPQAVRSASAPAPTTQAAPWYGIGVPATTAFQRQQSLQILDADTGYTAMVGYTNRNGEPELPKSDVQPLTCDPDAPLAVGDQVTCTIIGAALDGSNNPNTVSFTFDIVGVHDAEIHSDE